MTAARTLAALLLSALALLPLACRSASPGAPAAGCDNALLTAYPALLVLAPHPDDETLGFTGLIDAYVRAGKPVTVAVVTDGDAYCEACRFWKSGSVNGPMCSAEELSNLATPEADSFGEIRRTESAAATRILGMTALPRFLGYPDTGLAAAWRNLEQGKNAEPLRRSDFAGCTSCETCGYGEGPRTALTTDTLTASLRELIAAAPDGALIATTHWLDGHPDHAALGNFVRRLNDAHPVAFSLIHAYTKNTANADCWYPAPAAPDCPCMNDEARALADPAWVARNAAHRFRPSEDITLPSDADYGQARRFCLAGTAMKLRAVQSYPSQLGHLGRNEALHGIIDCSGYLTSFVRRSEVFILIEHLD